MSPFILGNKFEHLWTKIDNNRIWKNLRLNSQNSN